MTYTYSRKTKQPLTLEIFSKNVAHDGDCLLWTGRVNNTGHPCYYAPNNRTGHVRTWYARDVLQLTLGANERLGTWCRNPLCMSETHLYRKKDYCRNGHDLREGSVHRGWYPTTNRRYCRTCKNSSTQKSIYGIDAAEKKRMMESQGNACKICRSVFDESRSYTIGFIDHSHVDDHVRGILCGRCNTLLGMAGDDVEVLEAAIKYLVEDAYFSNFSERPTP